MLVTPFFSGQGLGNQLHNYVTIKTLALDRGLDFGVQFPSRFKGEHFMPLDMGNSTEEGLYLTEGEQPALYPKGITNWYKETSSDYDYKLQFVPDNTIVHGNLQGELYFEHRRDEIKEWLEVEPITISEDVCVINFRGGEYKYVPDFFLPREYWQRAIDIMRYIKPNMRFEVHTDDLDEAKRFFPDFPVISAMGVNWRSIRYAQYLIISNSSFAWLPAWLGDAKLIIAPEHWGRHNRGYWHLEQNKTKRFMYI